MSENQPETTEEVVEAVAGRRLNRHAIAGGATAPDRQEQLVADRRKQGRRDRAAVFHQRGRDRPIRMAADEAARAVDRIDHPDAARPEAGAVVGRLLGQPAVVGPHRRQAFMQQTIGLDIGFADRRARALDPRRRPGARGWNLST